MFLGLLGAWEHQSTPHSVGPPQEIRAIIEVLYDDALSGLRDLVGNVCMVTTLTDVDHLCLTL